MGKRLLISCILAIAVIVGIAFGSASLFSSKYDALMQEQQEAVAASQSVEEITLSDLATEAEQALKAETSTVEEPQVFENTQVGENTTDAYNVEAASSTRTVSTTDAASLRAAQMVLDMTLSEKICQMMIVTPEVLTGYSRVIQTGSVSTNAYSRYPVGGLMYYSQNLLSQDQTSEMISGIQDYAMELTGHGLFIVVDEEGGEDSVCADNLGTTRFEDMSTIGLSGNTAVAHEVGSTQATELGALGINLNLAPCADVLINESNMICKDRTFGWDANEVSKMVSQVVHGLVDNGMLCSPEAFPGAGSAGNSTINGFYCSDISYEELQEADLLPFRAAIDAGAPMITVGSVIYNRLDSEYPACMSPTIVTGILREELGFDGIIMTEPFSKGKLANYYPNSTAAVQSILAGCDMLVGFSNISAVIDAVTTAVENGTIQESQLDASCTRILSAKIRYGIIPAEN